jgi:acetyl-CoA carboxylase carboxyltransferase component
VSRLPTRIQRTPEFDENAAHHRGLARELRERLAVIREMGSARARQRHKERGRLLVRERIERLLDPGTPFVELMAFCADGVYGEPVPAAGMINGIGTVAGHQVMVLANDVTVKGGTLYPLTVQKQIRAQQIALENQLPCVYLVDSGGAFLPLQSEIFTPGGRIFYNEAIM